MLIIVPVRQHHIDEGNCNRNKQGYIGAYNCAVGLAVMEALESVDDVQVVSTSISLMDELGVTGYKKRRKFHTSEDLLHWINMLDDWYKPSPITILLDTVAGSAQIVNVRGLL